MGETSFFDTYILYTYNEEKKRKYEKSEDINHLNRFWRNFKLMVLNIYLYISIDEIVGNNYFYKKRSSEKGRKITFLKKLFTKKKWYVKKNKNRIQLAKMMMMWERETRNSSKKEVSEKGRQMLYIFFCGLKKTWFRIYVKEDSKNKIKIKKNKFNERKCIFCRRGIWTKKVDNVCYLMIQNKIFFFILW